MNKTLIPVMLTVALTLSITNTNSVQAQSILDIPKVEKLTENTNHLTTMINTITLVMNSCTGFDENLDSCVAFFERADKHLTAAITESKADIDKIIGVP